MADSFNSYQSSKPSFQVDWIQNPELRALAIGARIVAGTQGIVASGELQRELYFIRAGRLGSEYISEEATEYLRLLGYEPEKQGYIPEELKVLKAQPRDTSQAYQISRQNSQSQELLADNELNFIEVKFNKIYDKLIREGTRGQDIQRTIGWRYRKNTAIGIQKEALLSGSAYDDFIQKQIARQEDILREQSNFIERNTSSERQRAFSFQTIDKQRKDASLRTTALQSASKNLLDYDGSGNAFDRVNRAFQGWFGIGFYPRKAFTISYIGARCSGENFQRTMPIAILRYEVDRQSQSLKPGEVMRSITILPNDTTFNAGHYRYKRISPLAVNPGSVYVAVVFYYKESIDSRQNDRYHYGSGFGNEYTTDMSLLDCNFDDVEAVAQGTIPSTQNPDISLAIDSLTPNYNLSRSSIISDDQGLRAANVAIATEGPFSPRSTAPWVNTQRPRQP